MAIRTIVKPLPLWLANVVALLSGLAMSVAFPGLGWWPMAFVALFGLLWSLLGRSVWTGAVVGVVFGATMWLALINWLTLYLGPTPWIALAVTEALYITVATALITIPLNRATSPYESNPWRIQACVLTVAGMWVAHEALASVWPWGGFSWGRTGMSQASGPFATSASWIGISGISFVTIWLVTASMVTLARPSRHRKLVIVLPAAVLALLALIVPLYPTAYRGSTTISAVQANTRSGLFDEVSPGDNLAKNVDATLKFVRNPTDLVVWPENAADLDPLESAYAMNVLTSLSDRYQAPFLVGTITKNASGQYFNSSLLISQGTVRAQYDKVHPVPFAEYMPARDFFHALVPDLVDMVWRDYTPGTRNNVVTAGRARLGLAICFDIVDDQLIYNMLVNQADVIVAQTNNADFGTTVEHLQQLDIARLRAIETGRYVVNVSTVGTTAVIAPDGSLSQSLPAHAPGAITASVPLAQSNPPGLVVGRTLELGLSAFALAWVLVLLFEFKRRTRPNEVSRRGHSDR